MQRVLFSSPRARLHYSRENTAVSGSSPSSGHGCRFLLLLPAALTAVRGDRHRRTSTVPRISLTTGRHGDTNLIIRRLPCPVVVVSAGLAALATTPTIYVARARRISTRRCWIYGGGRGIIPFSERRGCGMKFEHA